MRFPQLSIGARFEYQGKLYSKTSALLASADDGSGQRIIPSYADLTPADASAKLPAPAPQLARVDMAAVFAALDGHHATCRSLLLEVSQDPSRIDAALAELEAARASLQDALHDASPP